jgi:hypothetical protein
MHISGVAMAVVAGRRALLGDGRFLVAGGAEIFS